MWLGFRNGGRLKSADEKQRRIGLRRCQERECKKVRHGADAASAVHSESPTVFNLRPNLMGRPMALMSRRQPKKARLFAELFGPVLRGLELAMGKYESLFAGALCEGNCGCAFHACAGKRENLAEAVLGMADQHAVVEGVGVCA